MHFGTQLRLEWYVRSLRAFCLVRSDMSWTFAYFARMRASELILRFYVIRLEAELNFRDVFAFRLELRLECI